MAKLQGRAKNLSPSSEDTRISVRLTCADCGRKFNDPRPQSGFTHYRVWYHDESTPPGTSHIVHVCHGCLMKQLVDTDQEGGSIVIEQFARITDLIEQGVPVVTE